MNEVNASMGFAHFIAQSDFVGKSLLAILVLMSAISWVVERREKPLLNSPFQAQPTARARLR